ncbi:MAG: hypothetical protein GX417_02845 [Clostridiales bacterium]|nr:hypothetical protein [Clostridiales bacterium]
MLAAIHSVEQLHAALNHSFAVLFAGGISCDFQETNQIHHDLHSKFEPERPGIDALLIKKTVLGRPNIRTFAVILIDTAIRFRIQSCRINRLQSSVWSPGCARRQASVRSVDFKERDTQLSEDGACENWFKGFETSLRPFGAV